MSRRIISADSHITEPPDTYTARIDKRFRDRAPRMERSEKLGDVFVVEGMEELPRSLVAAARLERVQGGLALTRIEVRTPNALLATGISCTTMLAGDWPDASRNASRRQE